MFKSQKQVEIERQESIAAIKDRDVDDALIAVSLIPGVNGLRERLQDRLDSLKREMAVSVHNHGQIAASSAKYVELDYIMTWLFKYCDKK